jgi:hypothetical protein
MVLAWPRPWRPPKGAALGVGMGIRLNSIVLEVDRGDPDGGLGASSRAPRALLPLRWLGTRKSTACEEDKLGHGREATIRIS